MTIEEFNEKKKKLATLKEKIAKNQGAYEQSMEALKEYGAATIEDAEKLLTDYQAKEAKAQEELETLLAEFAELAKEALL